MTAPCVVVDADVLGRQRTGDETYVRGLLAALARTDHGLDIRAVVRSRGLAPPGTTESVLPVRSYAARMAWQLPRRLQQIHPAAAHFQYLIPPAYRGPAVVTVHDISYDERPDLEERLDGFLLRRLVPRSLRRATRIITVSEWSKERLVTRYGLEPDRVAVTANGVDAAFTPDGARHQGDPYILFVGALRPRKDPVTVLEALALLDPGLRLVMIGPPKGEQARVGETIARLGLARRVEVLGHVGQEELAAYYRGAACLVLPSLYEGFGLPVLEAMACGTPVVATSVTSIPEIAGGAAVLVPPRDPEAVADGIRRALDDRPRLVAAGLERATHYSWAETARRTLSVYGEVIAEGGTTPHPKGQRSTGHA